MKNKKIAIVADWLTSRGGAEHVVKSLTEAFSDADIFTSVYEPKNFPEFKNRNVITTFLQKFSKRHQFLLPFFPKAFEKLDLSGYDIIISSSSSGFSKCVKKTSKTQIHICYCHTPIRYLYHARKEYINTYPLPWFARPVKLLLPAILNSLTKKDLKAVKEVDYFVSNSDFVGQRIKKFYKKNSKTIYPGVDTKPFVKDQGDKRKKDYFLAVGRFIPYKKFDLLIETFAKNGHPLILIGIGPELEKCKKMAKDLGAHNINFLGFVDRDELPKLFTNARAFLFPAEEDFGLTPVEAMSAGTPVIFYNKGGATESVAKGSGIAFNHQTVDSLNKAIEKFINKEKEFDIKKITQNGQKFDEKNFRENMIKFVGSIT